MEKETEQIQAGLSAQPISGTRATHPGEILRKDYLAPLNMSVNALAKALRVSITTVDDIVNERRAIDAELALRLVRYFGGDAKSWLNMQQTFDLKVAVRAHGSRIDSEITPRDDQSTIG